MVNGNVPRGVKLMEPVLVTVTFFAVSYLIGYMIYG